MELRRFLFFFVTCAINNALALSSLDLHNFNRKMIIKAEDWRALGGKLTLTSAEEAVNTCLMQRKVTEADYTFDNPQYLNFSNPYFSYKKQIPLSKVYQIIKQMPKGAALHVHDLAMLGPDYLVTVTYQPNLYVCFENVNVQLVFSANTPTTTCQGTWELMSTARANSGDVTAFDANLRKHFTIVTDDPNQWNLNINEVWKRFENYFNTIFPMLSYKPVWEQYFYDALKAFREDKIIYVEIRSVLPHLYDLNGNSYDEVEAAKAINRANNKFKQDYPDFIGAKLIYAPIRLVDKQTIASYVSIAKNVKTNVPDLFAGFDLVGQEDLGGPLKDFLPELLEGAKDLDYFFHAGETNWYGMPTDENLIDAILLGSKRLGHAYALLKHPELVDLVKIKRIGIEVNVISNEVLSLISDQRNHPLAVFFANDFPVVLSSDDPGTWEADPLSYDFYVAFQGIASKSADLRLLKTLALNSLAFSALKPLPKMYALIKFKKDWNDFVNNFVCTPA